LKVGDLPVRELRRRLATSGLRVRIGPLVVHVESPFDAVADAISLHYGEHEAAGTADFADFRVAVDRPAGLRGWVKPQALFRFEADPPFNPLPAAQAFPLFEWGLNWCISSHCHQYLVLHAAVVARGARALILPAPPGSGKSTLCAALVARGWRLFSDELALLDITSGALVPLPRPISLKNASIDVIRAFWPAAAMSRVVPDTLKGSVVHVRPPVDSVRAGSETARPAWVGLPLYQAGGRTELASLTKASAFMRLVDCAFNYSIHGRAGFETLAGVIADCGCFRFSYGGSLDEAVRTFDRLD
jgi:HprK-related kinase A